MLIMATFGVKEEGYVDKKLLFGMSMHDEEEK